MTFYNVISGILFLGACQAFLNALGKPAVFVAATLALVIFNDAILTSEIIERKSSEVIYSLEMKVLDLIIFIALTWALLALAPTANIFSVDVAESLWGANRPWVFWLMLLIYWLVVILWARISGFFKSRQWRNALKYSMYFMLVPPACSIAWYWSAQSFVAVSEYSGIIPCGFMVMHMLIAFSTKHA